MVFPHLHLSRATPPAIFAGVCQAFTGVAVTPGLVEKVELLRQARVAAAAPDREKSNLPLRFLIKHGFKGLESTLPKDHKTTLAYLDAYCRKRHRDVLSYEKFLGDGFGQMSKPAYDFVTKSGLNRYGSAGSTREREQVGQVLRLNGLNDIVASGVLRGVDGLYWQ